MKEMLQTLGIEYQPLSKFNSICPKCSHRRKKSEQKCLMVNLTKTSIGLRCFHDDCEYTKGFSCDTASNNDDIETIKLEAVPIKQGELPPGNHSGEIYWHPYVNRLHEIVFYVKRQYYIDVSGQKDKKCQPYFKNEDGDWFMNKPDNFPKTPYRYEHLGDSPNKRPVLIVEGELKADKAAEVLKNYDVLAWYSGSSAFNQTDWSCIEDREVWLWPDNDKPGKMAMEGLSKILKSETIYLLDPSILEEGQDIADIIADYKLIDAILRTKKNVGRPILQGIFNLDNLENIFSDELEGQRFGFSEMDKYISYPYSGLVIVPGRVGHGKSGLMVNMVAKLLRLTDSIVIMGTYEVITRIWLGRLLQVLDGKRYKTIDKDDIMCYDKRIQVNDKEDLILQEMLSYIKSGRLLITDKQNKAESLLSYMQKMSTSGKKVYTFIDYLQILPTELFRHGKRHIELGSVVQNFTTLANELKQVVVAGSQLSAGTTPYEDYTKESRALQESAELVLRVFNKNDKKCKRRDKDGNEKGDYYEMVAGEIVIDVSKTRLGKQHYLGFTLTNCTALKEHITQTEF